MKRIITVLSVLLAVILLAGCASEPQESKDVGATVASTSSSPDRTGLRVVAQGASNVDGTICWGAIINNPNEKWMVESFKLHYVAKDADGNVIAEDNAIEGRIYAYGNMGFGGKYFKSYNAPDLPEVASIEFTIPPEEISWVLSDTTQEEMDKELYTQNVDISHKKLNNDSTNTIVGDIVNNTSLNVKDGDAKLEVVFFNADGAVIGGDNVQVDAPLHEHTTTGFSGSIVALNDVDHFSTYPTLLMFQHNYV